MTLNEYLNTIDEEEREEIAETLRAIAHDDPEDFALWCLENGITTK